ncbi:MAG TPA: HD domain-containing phosphohydrolase [Atribacterota bacterium]|nr:HD domain-containing phosphohydrolase [Atribacterota bacterium]
MTTIFYYIGGAFWIGAIFYVFVILYASFLSTPKEGFAITLITFVSYSFIVLLEYFNLLPHKGLFKLTPSLYQNGQYIIATILLTGVAFTLIFITGKNFAQTLKQKNVELTQTKKELEELSNKLEERVRFRTLELKKSKDQLSVLYQISRTISSTLKLDDILQTILDFSIKISGADRGSIMLLDKKKRIFFIKIPYSKSEKNIDKITFAENENTIGWVVNNKKFLYIEDLENDKHFSKIKIILRQIKQLLIIPIIVEDKVIGVINLENTSLNPDTIDLLMSFSEGAAVAINNARLYQKIQDSYFEIAKALAQAIEAKDPYTHGHSTRVVEYTVLIAQKLDLQEEEIELLKYAAMLHDIGKIGVREIVLNNPKGLTGEEYDEIKKHPLVGESIVKPIELLQPIRPLIRHHHEWYNGKGYPDGLSGENIPLGARILAVADAYDAMKSDRPYRKALTEETAIQELKRGNGTQFEPKIVEVFLEILKQK